MARYSLKEFPSQVRHQMREMTIIVESLREVAEELGNLSLSSGAEETLLRVADRIEEKYA